MKFIVILIFYIVGVNTSNPTNNDNKDSDMVNCLFEHELDPGIYSHKKLETQLPTENQKNCFLACMFKKIGYMNKDGTINIESILSNVYEPERRIEGEQKLNEIVKTCQIRAENDICKLARCLQDLRKSPN